jgi:hypothetical protein
MAAFRTVGFDQLGERLFGGKLQKRGQRSVVREV